MCACMSAERLVADFWAQSADFCFVTLQPPCDATPKSSDNNITPYTSYTFTYKHTRYTAEHECKR